jgi:tRNA-splicing ligase RtcB (3'-phosphate/5'-hydroxy nucleic acid ligase)
MDIIGRYNTAKVYTDIVDSETLSQIYQLLNIPAFADTQIRIMPDVHYGSGAVVGFTMTMNEFICPKVIGVDIGCGVSAYKIGQVDFSLPEFDTFLRANIPSGREVNSSRRDKYFDLTLELGALIEKVGLKDYDRIIKGIGTLGGGNHFIELSVDDEKNIWLIIHSGSRYLGLLVCEFHQQRAREQLINKFQGAGAYHNFEFMPVNEGGREYIEDMKLTQQYASTNRRIMAQVLIEGFFSKKFKACTSIESVHNYIDFADKVIRKGAISAAKDKLVIIPMNMRDGSILARGKGNADWNFSAPHGAGRILSRGDAKELITMNEYKESMKGIYSTSVLESTIDESPMAYKSMDVILPKIQDTVEIISMLKPVYNYKAGN